MRRRPRRNKRPSKKKDNIKVKIPENCYKCIWGTKPTIKQVKIKCTKRDAEVVKEDEGWMCYSYSDKKMLEEKNYRKESTVILVNWILQYNIYI